MKSLCSAWKIGGCSMTASLMRKKSSQDGVKQSLPPLRDQNQKVDSLLPPHQSNPHRSQLSRRGAANEDDDVISDEPKDFIMSSIYFLSWIWSFPTIVILLAISDLYIL